LPDIASEANSLGLIKPLKSFDWTGLALLAIFLGTLEYVLEEGAADNWFQSAITSQMIFICAISGVMFLWRMFAKPNPLVDFAAFKNRNFASGCIFSFSMGIGLYGLTYLYPVYLARVHQYSALKIGETMFVSGVAMFLTAPIAGRLSTTIDPRIMIGGGFIGFAIGTYLASGLTTEWGFYELLWPQILRGVLLMMCMVTVTNIALGTLTPIELRGESGLFNLTRNLGGAVGLALINTLINQRMDLHLARSRESIGWSHDKALQTLQNMTYALSPLGSEVPTAALKKLSGLVRQQATDMAIADIFVLLTFLFVGIVFLTPLLSKPKLVASAAGGGHWTWINIYKTNPLLSSSRRRGSNFLQA
jgi:MFS transporter, DHA2 family, multidrug resistance protein